MNKFPDHLMPTEEEFILAYVPEWGDVRMTYEEARSLAIMRCDEAAESLERDMILARDRLMDEVDEEVYRAMEDARGYEYR